MRLIDADALIAWLTKVTGFRTNCEDCTEIDCLDCIIEEAIKNAPTIEAKPVVHAHWEEVREGRHICSNCKVKASSTSDEYDYMEDLSDFCPHCGAQMDEFAGDINVGSKGVKIPVISMEDVPKLAKEMEK